jgi:methylglutaconyl-CoA hydratase
MTYLDYRVQERVAYISLNRPEKRNAFSRELVAALKQAFETAAADQAVKVVVLRAEGKVFCAGADLDYLQGLQNFSYQENLEDSTFLKDLYLQIFRFPKVVMAAVQGHALAGGCGLVTACDFAFAVPEAKFGYTEVKIGFVPAIVAVLLLKKVGQARARQLLLSGDQFTAAQMQQWGLITELVAADQLETHVHTFAQHLCRTNSAEAMTATKLLINEVQELSLEDGLQAAAAANAKARGFDDCRAGIAAFLNKQPVGW